MDELKDAHDWAVRELYAHVEARRIVSDMLARDPYCFPTMRGKKRQRQMALLADVSQSAVSRLETGVLSKLGADTLRRLLKAYMELADGAR